MQAYSPKYLSCSYKLQSSNNKENSHSNANTADSNFLLENLFNKLHYFSSSSQSFLKSAEKMSKHISKEPLADRTIKDYVNQKRVMENSLDVLVY